MVKITEYINTNPRPVEIVQEIENHGEYQSDWLTHFKQAIQSSGIVSKSLFNSLNPETYTLNCYKDCNYANPDCECYISMNDGRYVPLYLTCPAPRYKDGREFCTDKTPGPWTHSICGGGRVYINTSLTIKCMKPGCGTTFQATDAFFECSSHRSNPSKASKSEFGNALTALNSLWKNKSPIVKAYIEKMMEKRLQEEGFYYE